MSILPRLLLASLLTLGNTALAQEPYDRTQGRIVIGSNVRVRTAPSDTAAIDTILPLGTVRVILLADQPADTSWVRVRMDFGPDGYIRSHLVRRIPPGGLAAALEELAHERLALRVHPYRWRIELYQALSVHRDAPVDPETAGRIALVWMKTVASLVAVVPPGQHEKAPYNGWWGERLYDGVAGYWDATKEWGVEPEGLFAVHDQHRGSSSADEIAWTVRQIGGGPRCSGRIACIIGKLDTLDGGYLRRHPNGRHARESVANVRAVASRVAADTSGFDPVASCPMMMPLVASLRLAVVPTTVSERAAALRALDRVAARCEITSPR